MRIIRQTRSEPTSEFLAAIQRHKQKLLKGSRSIVQQYDDSCSTLQRKTSGRLNLSPNTYLTTANKRSLQATNVPWPILALVKEIQADLIKYGRESIAQHLSNQITDKAFCQSGCNSPKPGYGTTRNREVAVYISHFVAVIDNWLEEVQEIITLRVLRQVVQYFEDITRQLFVKIYPNQMPQIKLTPAINCLFEAISNCFKAIQITSCTSDSIFARQLDESIDKFRINLKKVLFVYDWQKLCSNRLIH